MAALWLVATLLGGCSGIGTRPEVDPALRTRALLDRTEWRLHGRIGVKAGSDGGQGDLHWEQAGAQSRIRISGPFGAGGLEMSWDPARVTVTGRGGSVSREWVGADAAERMLAEQLGWTFPATSIRYWLLGLADPGAPAVETRDPAGLPASIEQGAWRVEYQRFTEAGGLLLPARLSARSAEVRVRLVIDEWEF